MEILNGRLVVQRRVAALFVVVAQPAFGQDPGLSEAGADFAIEVFAAKCGVETLAEGILPGAAGVDVVGSHLHPSQPRLDGPGDELGAVVGAEEGGRAVVGEDGLEHGEHVDVLEAAPYLEGEAAPVVLVGEYEVAQFAPVPRGVLDEVIGPHVVGVGGLKRHLAFLVAPLSAFPKGGCMPCSRQSLGGQLTASFPVWISVRSFVVRRHFAWQDNRWLDSLA